MHDEKYKYWFIIISLFKKKKKNRLDKFACWLWKLHQLLSECTLYVDDIDECLVIEDIYL